MAAKSKQDFQALVLSCNKDGMDALRKGQLKAAFDQFKYAESILIADEAEVNNMSLLAVTCNNLGCYYKKVGKFHGALSYLRRALKMEADMDTDEVTLAGTHLNICAILSKLEKHDKAVQHAMSALDLINRRVSITEPEKVSQDDYSVLAIAYHNVAVERDFLQQYESAAAAFQQGYQVAKRCLGEEHPLSITLGKNSDAVLQKAIKLKKKPTAAAYQRALKTESAGLGLSKEPLVPGGTELTLPSLVGSQANIRSEDTATVPPGSLTARQEARDWVASEEQAWNRFASDALTGSTPRAPAPLPNSEYQPIPPARPLAQFGGNAPPKDSPQMARSLDASSQAETATYSREITLSSSIPKYVGRQDHVRHVLDDPESMIDIIDADRTGHSVGGAAKIALNDYRPNRMIKGSTRTNRVIRRTNVHNCTKYRDMIMSERTQNVSTLQRSAYMQKMAAERIQRAWRAWYRYCQANSDWMTTTWIAATMIQANWRSYHVRRVKLDRAATAIQKHVRGHLIRKILKQHSAAITIQRHAVGMITRMQLRRLHRAAIKMQSLIRGGLARKRVRKYRAFLTKIALTIQCAWRCHVARWIVKQRREAKRQQEARVKAAIDIQRVHRGNMGRQRYRTLKEKYLQDAQERQAATKIQAMARRDAAIKRVDQVRADKLFLMNKAATTVRKIYLGAKQRKRFRALLAEFGRHIQRVITIQRYGRGFLVRLRMWREAIRAEEEMWATMEIQRVWRGYLGRVAWESKFEQVWRREMASVRIQRHIRGWLARTRVGRTRRLIARTEFERARKRFRASQRLQALARGVLSRKVTNERRRIRLKAVTTIQRHFRGHRLRRRLWTDVMHLRATFICAVARGFLVRNRRFHLVAKVICIQRGWRRWTRRPKEQKQKAFEQMRERKRKAAIIQAQFRKHHEAKEVKTIQATF